MTTATRHGDLQQPGRAQPTAKSRIGLIVALSMAAGLIAAVVLVAMPFIPATENVLTGVVLLGFALGWALLAVLSTRFSDQPQRWAAAPAMFMAVAGLVSLSGSAAVQAGFSWVWPPVLFGLVVWMFLRVRREHAQPNRTVAAVPRTGRVADRLRGRRLPDRARIARRQGLSAARPADRCGRAPAAPALHRLGQPHGRPGTGWRRVVLRLRLDHSGRGPRHPSLRLRPRRPRLERRQRRPAGRCPYCRGPAHAASTRRRSRAVRAGRPLVRRPLRPKLRRPIPRPGRRPGAPRLHRTQTRPSPDRQHRSLQRHRSRRRLIGRVRSPRSRTVAQPNLLHNSSATLPGRGPRQLLDRAAPLRAPSRSMQWRTRRCSRRRP